MTPNLFFKAYRQQASENVKYHKISNVFNLIEVII